MGLFDSFKKLGDVVEGLNEAAGSVSKGTVEDYGEPAYTLYSALELGDMHRRINITDEQEQVKYYTKSSVFVLKGKTEIMDADGNIVAHLEKSYSTWSRTSPISRGWTGRSGAISLA